MADKNLVIVESPTKARTISKFLDKSFKVLASNGHIRDLPNNAAEIPIKFKKEPWSRLGVNVEADFDALYVVPKSKKDNVKQLKDSLKEASFLFLATDEDREGESISWHLIQTLKPKVPFSRLVFHEITPSAIKAALENARAVDEDLVRAQETRRIIDRLFGYELSPLLWKKIAPELSAGRVQSVAVRLLVERERERMAFVKAGYWSLKASFSTADSPQSSFEAELTQVEGKRVAQGRDFDAKTGKLFDPNKVVFLDEAYAASLLEEVKSSQANVSSLEEKRFTNKPSPPFVTSTLQQEANRKLRFSAKRTMSLAQQLYENGFITYMRTDSTGLSDQALNAARTLIKADYGQDYLPEKPRVYKTQVKNAQEAHEAIRPAGEQFTSIEAVRGAISGDASKLYELIWKRTIASQMTDARGTNVSVLIDAGRATFRASGKIIEFPGFLRAYVEGSDDPEAELSDQERILPPLTEGMALKQNSVESVQKSTQPPARFTEGSIVRELEQLGIGRPSTWATVVDTVLNRAYAFKKGTALVPSFTGFAVVQLLERYFSELINYEFTARLEDDLDAISRGEASNLKYLKSFYFGNGHPGLRSLIEKGEERIDPREVCGIPIGKSKDDKLIEIRVGRYGPFISDGERRAAIAPETAPDEVTVESAVEALEKAAKGPDELGIDPDTGLPIYLKVGPYGPYVQLGLGEEGKRPKMASLLAGMKEEDVDIDLAIKLLSLPRTLGEHPESKQSVIAANGRYGPYIKCGTDTRSIPVDENSPLEITLEQALALLAQPKARRGASTNKLLKSLGKVSEDGPEVSLRSGRYGPYVTDGEINASVPRSIDSEQISLEEAVSLIEERRAKAPTKKKSRKKKKT